jgi:transcriptional regulator with GAF, ATPase, and Fis domain
LLHGYHLNVRELESLLWHRLIAGEAEPGFYGSAAPRPAADAPSARTNEGEISSERLQRCLDDNNGSLEATWRALGMKNRFALMRAIKKHDLEVRRRPNQPKRVS